MPNWRYIRTYSDMNELYAIAGKKRRIFGKGKKMRKKLVVGSIVLLVLVVMLMVSKSICAETGSNLITKVYRLKYESPQKTREFLKKSLPPCEGRKIEIPEKVRVLAITDLPENHDRIKKLLNEYDKAPQRVLVKFIQIKIGDNKPPIVNTSKIITHLDATASMGVKDKNLSSYCYYKVTPSLTDKGRILLKVNYEIKEPNGHVESGNTQVTLNDHDVKSLGGIADDKTTFQTSGVTEKKERTSIMLVSVDML